MLDQAKIQQLHQLCSENPDLNHLLNDVFSSLDQELGRLNQLMRTELAIVFGSIHTLIQKNPTLTEQEAWKILYENFIHLNSYVDECDAQRTRMCFRSSNLDLVELCERILNVYRATAEAHHVQMSLQVDPEAEEHFRHFFVDTYLIQESIMGLFRHSFEYIPNVTYLRIYLKAKDETHGIIHVEQVGCAISRHDLDILQKGEFSQSLYELHSGILTAKRFVNCCRGQFEIQSSDQSTFIDMHLAYQLPEIPEVDFTY